VKLYVAELRSRLKPAFRPLSFLPGGCAQVDWGSWKNVGVEGVRRRLSFFAMILCHSRMLYVERIASHVRSYGRCKDVAHPDHERELLCKRKHARERKLAGELLRLCPGTECYCIKMRESRSAWRDHIRRIVALVGIYGRCAVANAIDDAHRFEAYSSDYIQNILESRACAGPEPDPLHLTRKTDLLQLPSPDTNLELYGE